MKISFRFVIPCLKRLTFQRHGMTLTLVGIFLSGCIHRNQQAWSDQRENRDAQIVQLTVTSVPTVTPTPTLQEFIEQKMKELDEIADELSEIDQLLRSRLDETE